MLKKNEDQIFHQAVKPLNIPLGGMLFSTRLTNTLSKKLAALIDADTEILNVHDKTFKVAGYFSHFNKFAKSAWMMNDLPLARWNAERFEIREGWQKKILRWLADLPEITAMRKLNSVIVLDNLNKAVVLRYLGKNAEVVRSGLDITEFKGLPRELDLNNKPLRLLMVGIMSTHRRFEDAIMAVSILKNLGKNVILDIVGPYDKNSDYKKFLDGIIVEKELQETVKFLGPVPETALLEAYKSHDIFLFPNHNQTWGLSVFEAMAMGLPVVVSKTCGASEMVADGVTAYLVDPKSPEQIAEKINLLLDPGNYKNISAAAYEFARKNISWDAYAQGMESIFKNLVK